MTPIRLTEEALVHPVARELKTLLESILGDNVVEHCEVDELRHWVDSRMEYSEEIPALSHLNWILQVVLSDQSIEPLEWAMLRAAIEKVLPEKSDIQISRPPNRKEPGGAASEKEPMGSGDRWVIIDTETSGLLAPIYAVEIAAQRMHGWRTEGQPFRVLLNHDVELEPTAVATHGYTRAFLRSHGIVPDEAHARLAEYAGGLQMVSHNLAYDFNRVLEPEWGRLGLSMICPAGFCTVMLSRRCLPEISSAALNALATQFALGEPTHHAGDDVNITVRLVTDVLVPRLEAARVRTFHEAKAFSKKTPLSECRRLFGAGVAASPPRAKRPGLKARKFKAFLQQLTGDHVITNHEFAALQHWLETEGCRSVEAAQAADLVERILADGQVASDELAILGRELEKLAAS